mgnify:CR=1 FL=1
MHVIKNPEFAFPKFRISFYDVTLKLCMDLQT